jgi:uncharacterized membrane protein YdjX (TVP38/TMEM64 family)
MQYNQEMLKDNSVEAAQSPKPASAKRRGRRRVVLLGAVLILLMTLAYVLPIRHWLSNSGQVRHAMAALGPWAFPASMIVVATLVGCGVPRLLVCAVAGMVLGFWWGLFVVQVGTLLGYYAIFLFIRWGGRDWALRHWPTLHKWANLVHAHGFVGVILLRQLPIHGTVVNLGLGLSHVKHRHFLIGTAIGSLPEAIPATLAGAGLVKVSMKTTSIYLAVAMVVLALVWIGCGYLARAMKKSRSGAELLAEAEVLKGEPL